MNATKESLNYSPQERINTRLYSRADLVPAYARLTLSPPESSIMVRYRDDIVGCRVLDLGCGAGRLAGYLRPLTEHYVGLDVSPHMLQFCRRQYAGLRFLQGDMRDLAAFADKEFDVVFAIANLFDAVCHADRLLVLKEVHRILTPTGLLVFSSHNRNYSDLGSGPRLNFSRNPVTLVRCIVDFVHARSNYRRIKPHRRFEPEYALVNDCAHNFANLHYYVSRTAQEKQLAEMGFRLIECVDEAGYTLKPDDEDGVCTSIHYAARLNP